MVPGDSFLNHDLVEPFNVVEKALHIISSEYPWSDIKLLYEIQMVHMIYLPFVDPELGR